MYISQVSGERLQDHWSSGVRKLRIKDFVCMNQKVTEHEQTGRMLGLIWW